MSVRQANQRNVIFATIGNFHIQDLSFNHMFVIDVIIYQ